MHLHYKTLTFNHLAQCHIVFPMVKYVHVHTFYHIFNSKPPSLLSEVYMEKVGCVKINFTVATNLAKLKVILRWEICN